MWFWVYSILALLLFVCIFDFWSFVFFCIYVFGVQIFIYNYVKYAEEIVIAQRKEIERLRDK